MNVFQYIITTESEFQMLSNNEKPDFHIFMTLFLYHYLIVDVKVLLYVQEVLVQFVQQLLLFKVGRDFLDTQQISLWHIIYVICISYQKYSYILCVQEVVNSIYIMSYYINWGNYFLDTWYLRPILYVQEVMTHFKKGTCYISKKALTNSWADGNLGIRQKH